MVAVPANHSPVLRIRGALRATAIAEGFRDEGKKVLLIMDSLTRVAHAGREIGLALGEPASARGYPPSAIAMLPKLIERAVTSVSRVMTDIAEAPHIAAARMLRRRLAAYEENRDLVLMGAYRGGADPEIDAAIAYHPAVMEYIRQDADAIVSLDEAVAELIGVFGDGA